VSFGTQLLGVRSKTCRRAAADRPPRHPAGHTGADLILPDTKLSNVEDAVQIMSCHLQVYSAPEVG
jgi:hypothetical protein